jgi:Arc/MetJ-type ribon-helix-helix transcriptional regulator
LVLEVEQKTARCHWQAAQRSGSPVQALRDCGRDADGRILAALRRNSLSRILKAMDVQLTPDQKAFARRAIESGRLHSEQDAVQEALALWEERERKRTEFLLTLDDAKASLARGEGRVITQESMQQLAQEVKERGRTRLLAELTTSR